MQAGRVPAARRHLPFRRELGPFPSRTAAPGPVAVWSTRTWEGAVELGAIGPGDARGRRFGRMGHGACLLFPQGALYNEHLIHIGAETIVGP